MKPKGHGIDKDIGPNSRTCSKVLASGSKSRKGNPLKEQGRSRTAHAGCVWTGVSALPGTVSPYFGLLIRSVMGGGLKHYQ